MLPALRRRAWLSRPSGDGPFVEFRRIAPNHRERASRTLTDARSHPIAEHVGHDVGFAVDDAKGPFHT
jgi:hypothetical protein